MTTTCSLDYSTTAVADKFGNLAIVRLPHNTNDDVTEDPTGTQSLWDRGLLSGASQKSDCVSVTHIGKGRVQKYLLRKLVDFSINGWVPRIH